MCASKRTLDIDRNVSGIVLRQVLQEYLVRHDDLDEFASQLRSLDPLSIRIIGAEFEKMNRLDLSRQCSQQLISLNAASVEDKLVYASRLMHFRGLATRRGHYSDALAMFREVRSLSPDNISALVNIGLYWLDSMEPPSLWEEETIAVLARAVELDKGNMLAMYALALAYEACGRRREAVEVYWFILQKAPVHMAATIRLSWPDNWQLLSRRQRESVLRCKKNIVSLEDISTFNGVDPSAIQEVFGQYGMVVIKGLIAGNRLDNLRLRYADILRSRCNKDSVGMWPMSDINIFLVEAVRELVEETKLHEYLSATSEFSAGRWSLVEHNAWHIQYRTAGDRSPTPIHQDHPVLSNRSDFWTCWFPAVDCGNGCAPGIRLYTDFFQHPVHLCQQFSEAPACLPDGFIREYLSDRYIHPCLNAGDVVIFGPHIFHETEVLENSKGFRISCDIRYKMGSSAWAL